MKRDVLEKIHEETRPSSDTVMQKVVAGAKGPEYFMKKQTTPDGISMGYTSRAVDVIGHKDTYDKMREALRLDYEGGKKDEERYYPENPSDKTFYIVRYKMSEDDCQLLELPTDKSPCGANGYTTGKDTFIPEWISPKEEHSDKSIPVKPTIAAIYKNDGYGNETLVASYDPKRGQWYDHRTDEWV